MSFSRFGYIQGLLMRNLLSFLFLLVIALCLWMAGLTYWVFSKEQSFQIAPLLASENGQVSRLVCDAGDPEFEKIALQIAVPFVTDLLSFEKDNERDYAVKADEQRKILEDGSLAAETFRDILSSNLARISKEGARFEVDRSRSGARSDPRNPKLLNVALSGKLSLVKPQGVFEESVDIDLVLIHNANRGQSSREKVFLVRKFTNPLKGR